MTPAPSSVQIDQPLHAGQIPDSYQGFLEQPIEAFGGLDGSLSQLDMAFHDLFDFSLPNAFRNPTTWEYFNMANEESSGGLC